MVENKFESKMRIISILHPMAENPVLKAVLNRIISAHFLLQLYKKHHLTTTGLD